MNGEKGEKSHNDSGGMGQRPGGKSNERNKRIRSPALRGVVSGTSAKVSTCTS